GPVCSPRIAGRAAVADSAPVPSPAAAACSGGRPAGTREAPRRAALARAAVAVGPLRPAPRAPAPGAPPPARRPSIGGSPMGASSANLDRGPAREHDDADDLED